METKMRSFRLSITQELLDRVEGFEKELKDLYERRNMDGRLITTTAAINALIELGLEKWSKRHDG